MIPLEIPDRILLKRKVLFALKLNRKFKDIKIEAANLYNHCFNYLVLSLDKLISLQIKKGQYDL